MLSISLIDGVIMRLIDGVANRLLRLFGGPDQVPQRNEDLVWY